MRCRRLDVERVGLYACPVEIVLECVPSRVFRAGILRIVKEATTQVCSVVRMHIHTYMPIRRRLTAFDFLVPEYLLYACLPVVSVLPVESSPVAPGAFMAVAVKQCYCDMRQSG